MSESEGISIGQRVHSKGRKILGQYSSWNNQMVGHVVFYNLFLPGKFIFIAEL